jgi:hypothetical protein
MTTTTTIPELEHHAGSWVAIDRETGRSVFETFSRSVALKINQERFRVVTILQHLSTLTAREGEQPD